MRAYKDYRHEPAIRTLHLPADCWQSCKKLAKRQGVPVRQVIQEAVTAQAARVINDLQGLGLRGGIPQKLVRVPLAPSVLEAMAEGRQKTGLTGISLLGAYLHRYLRRRIRKS